MSLKYSNELLNDIPVPPDGVSSGKLNATGISPYLKIDNTIYSGSYGYETLTITLKGLPIDKAPFDKPTPANIATNSFTFRNRTWKVIKVEEGNRISIGNNEIYLTWTVTGVDTNNPILEVS